MPIQNKYKKSIFLATKAKTQGVKAENAVHFTLISTFLFFICLSAFGLYKAALEQLHYANFITSMKAVKTIINLPSPVPSQADLDFAFAAYSIENSPFNSNPTYFDSIEDRGLTTGGLIDKRKKVIIGPSAFISWGVLGSTIGHEVEIHGNQSFVKIVIEDSFAKYAFSAKKIMHSIIPSKQSMLLSHTEEGTSHAERDAYFYEIRSAKRFGLDSFEIQSIANIINTYYTAQK